LRPIQRPLDGTSPQTGWHYRATNLHIYVLFFLY